jgi:hypothetical protein
MKTTLNLAITLLLASSVLAGEIGFKAQPTAKRLGEQVRIAFDVSVPTDVEVAILDGRHAVVKHLAAGVVGDNPPAPLRPGLSQELYWDGRDDFGRPATGGPFQVRVRAGTQLKFGRLSGADPYNCGTIDSLATDENGNVYVGLLYWPPDAPLPDGFQMNRVWTEAVGAVVKFDPKQGGAMPGDDGAQRASAITGALNVYPGLAPFSKAGLGGNTCCVCRGPRFDLDRYGRLALPNAVTCQRVALR